MHDNLTVNGLWIEGRLSLLELLTLKSFTAHGHRFVLWAYGEIPNELPAGVEIRDATEVVPRSEVFCYRRGKHAGSYGGFSDIFRYKLLYERGGWWVDMDVTCLRPFAFAQPYVFRPHSITVLVGNILKVPPKSKVMRRCYEWARRNVDADNEDWHKPIRILAYEAFRLGLQKYTVPQEHFSSDCEDPIRLATTEGDPSPAWYAVHWCNEWMKKKGIHKEAPISGTGYHRILQRYGLAPAVEVENAIAQSSFDSREE